MYSDLKLRFVSSTLYEVQRVSTPTVEDFKKTVSDYLAWEVSTLLKNQPSENERLGK